MKAHLRYFLLLFSLTCLSYIYMKWAQSHKRQTDLSVRQSYLDRSLVDYSSPPPPSSSSSSSSRRYDQCSYFSNCFSLSKCDPSGPIKVHIDPYPPTVQISPTFAHILSVIRDSVHYTPNKEEACILISSNHDTLDRDPLSPNFSHKLPPLPDDGRNYLVFNLFSGSWPNYSELDFNHWSPGMAILAKASFSLTHYRPMFDISLPLFPNSHPLKGITYNHFDNSNPPHSAKKHLLVFKGKRYTYGIGSETRNALHHLHSPPDVIILTTCKHGKKWQELRDERCDHDNQDYDSYDYLSLMSNSSFCLVPRGRRLASFRFLESLEVGCVPVLLSNEWVLPFEDVIDWSIATVRANERLLFQIPEMLRNVQETRLLKMRAQAQALYETYFSSIERIVLTTVTIIEERVFRDRGRESFMWNRVVTPGCVTGGFMFHKHYNHDIRRYPGYSNQSLGFTAILNIDQPVTSQTIVKLFKQVMLKSVYFKHLIIKLQTPNLSPVSSIMSHSSVSLVSSTIKFPLKTDAVFFLDPQTILTSEELDFAYSTWVSFPHRIVGFVARDHYYKNMDWHFSSKWTDQFSSVLMESAIFHNYYLFLYKYLNYEFDECFYLRFMFMVSHWTREPPLKISQRHSTLPSHESSSQSYSTSQQCFSKLIKEYTYIPLIHSQVRLDPVLFKDDVSMTRKKYKKMEVNQ